MSAPTTSELTDTVVAVVADEMGLGRDQLAPETDLRTVEGADSIKVLRIIARIEQRYDVELEDEDVFGVSTVAEVVDVVARAIDDGRRA